MELITIPIPPMNKRNNNLLNEYYNYVGTDSARARSVIFKMNYQSDGYLLSCIALTYRDEAIFFKNGRTRNDIKVEKMILAKEYIDMAYEISPLCRDVLFMKGTIYNSLHDQFSAIDCFIKILESKEDGSLPHNCSESDSAYIKMVTNDARFQLYRLFHNIQEFDISGKFLKEYKTNLKKGVKTIYIPLRTYLVK